LLIVARRQHPEVKRFIKFLFVGAMGFVVDFGGFNLFHFLGIGPWVATHLIPIDFLLEHPEVIEQSLSFCAAVLSNFTWNYLWIYPEAKEANQAKKVTKFFIVSVVGLVLGIPVFSLALSVSKGIVATMGLSTLKFNLAGNLALVCRVGVLLFWNFFVNRFWTYRDVKRA
jgi:putative flippase GtrA